MALNSNPETTPQTQYYDVGAKVVRTGFIYKVTGRPRRDGKYPVQRINPDGTLDLSDPDVHHFAGKDLHPYV